jgi:hypothetical protein
MKSWQAEGEAYVRDNPIKAVSMALGLGLLLGLLSRKDPWSPMFRLGPLPSYSP